MLRLDTKRGQKEQIPRGPGKDYYLLEVKGFDKQTSQKPDVDGNADKHEYVLICPQGSDKPSGKRVPLNQKMNQRDYMLHDNMMNNMNDHENYIQSSSLFIYFFFVYLLLKSIEINRFFTHFQLDFPHNLLRDKYLCKI